ncbi:cyclase family protein [Streptomyces hygroscopicus subsp. hygroscopicus]|uniref:Kynurenine formamidase n=1 Tax=Streptomyces demainii TaxID=588122 RepID=A0ABT9L1S8_9ACTN|nr:MULTISPECIES: cyclase family protein [Streptomyces]MBW8091106.1 cyclase family protein [Streptomyces hygroscopicus subsp. hygroscopicus]MDN3054161.1 cyclase family protein [Streptomyces sp. SRF1]MDP9614656.1 kynurenine formamidase [Streptomyces demainii]
MDTHLTETDASQGLPSNWGRWGEDDERGTLNLITGEARARGAAEARTGRTVSLALPIRPTPVISGPFAPSAQDASPVQQMMVYVGSPAPATADVMLVTNHHPRSTHLDALGHTVRDGRVYPGRPVDEAVTPAGARHGSTAAYAAGIATRGILLDLAADGPLPSGHAVTSRDLEAAEERQGVRLESGDALVVRCGWPMTPVPGRPMPGMSLDAVRWMHRRGAALYAGDIGDAHPGLDPACPLPLHGVALPLMGLPLIDAAEVDDLAAVCAELGRYAFLLIVAPPRIHGLTGVPVNPLAIF